MRQSILIINFETEGINPRLCKNSRDSVMDACRRWNCDFIEISHNNWKLTLAPAATKTELFTGIDAERVLVLDSDIVIRQDTPNPFVEFPEDSMAVVNNATPRWGEYSIIKQIEHEEWVKVEGEYGPAPYVPFDYFNTGMMMMEKALHTDVMRTAKEIHVGLSIKNIGLNWVDQTPINWATKKLGTKMIMVDESWNYVHPEQLGNDWLTMKKYIYHFAGTPARNELMPRVIWK